MALGRRVKTGRGRRWAGGYIHHETDGRTLFIIEKQVRGKRFHISTRCHDERAAMEQLKRFEANPLGYTPVGEAKEEPLLMTVELITGFFEYQTKPIEQGGKASTRHYAKEGVRKLRDWMVALGKRDLKKLDVPTLKKLLEQWPTSRKQRIIYLKSFFSWMREEQGLLKTAEDATLDLPVPQSNPEKFTRRKVADWQAVLDVYEELPQRYRDYLQFFAATGWHITEVNRFIRQERNRIEKPGIRVLDDRGREVKAVLINWHKTKKWTRTGIVDAKHLEAIERLKAEGTVPRKPNQAVREALERADAKRQQHDPTWRARERFTFGVMRHSVATWGVELGATKDQAAAHLDHADKRTTDRFYLDLAVPKPPIPTRALTALDEGERTIN